MSVLRTGLIAAVVSIGLSAVNSGSMEPCGSLQGGFSGNYRELEQRNPWSNGGRNQWDNSTWSNPDPRQPYGGQRKPIPRYCIHTAGYLPPDWFQYNTPVISYETNRGDGRGDILSGYLGQGRRHALHVLSG